MNYTGTALVALVILLIINYDIIIKNTNDTKRAIPAYKPYRLFLLSVIIFYVCDVLWGLFNDLGLVTLNYIDTVIFFIFMAFSVFLWTRYVIYYIKSNNYFTRFINIAGWFFLILEWAIVIINFFTPVLFSFDETGKYTAGSQRYVNMGIQLVMFLLTAVYMLYVALKSSGKIRSKHMAIGLFGIVMTVFVLLQMLDPFMALYSVGYMIGTCLLHTFVTGDVQEDRLRELKRLEEREQQQKQELGSARQLAYTDSLTGVRNKHAYAEKIDSYNNKIANRKLKELAVIVFDINGLKKINDSKGHDEGDKYIKEGSHIICRWFKRSPVFRIGGDEFVAFLEGDDYRKRFLLLSGFEKLIERNIAKEYVVISTGMDDFDPMIDKNIETVFIRADKKMYDRKKALKNMGSL
ncbi:MAG: GGDEF domain-containing protein [Lachnospiraceae bacterium]|nr:GGDEF domain-containing protein [Lachnospiraceae bacterium]